MNSNFELSQEPSFEDNTSWFSFIFMFYLDSLFLKGISKPLVLSDLGGIREADKSSGLHIKFNIAWKDAIEKSKLTNEQPNLWRILWITMGYSNLYLSLGLFFISAGVQFGPVLILNRLVSYFQGSITFSDEWLWTLVLMLFILPILCSICLAHSNRIMAHCGAQVRNVLIGVIYRKSLTLSSASRQSVSTGRIITMFSENTNQIKMFLFFICNTFVAPFQIAACLWLLYNQVGISAFVGLAFIIVTLPLNGLVFGLVNKLFKEKLIFTDQRVKLMNEVLAGIRIIKYYAWETAFNEKITSIRNSEVLILQKAGYIFNTAMSLLLLGAPTIQTVLIFFTYTELGNKLDAAKAFTTLSLFGMMTSPFIFLPFGLQQYNQSLVSTARIMEFLLVDDQEDYIEKYEKDSNEPIQYSIIIENASMSWMSNAEIIEAEKLVEEKKILEKAENVEDINEVNKNDSNYSALPVDEVVNKDIGNSTEINRNIYTLSNISVNIKEGSLVAIVGSVGSGKSSFLATILGEMNKKSGTVSMLTNMNYAYCDQRPWIVNASIKNNILFGKEYNEEKFNNAIYSACMNDDLKIFADGVNTEIGERGVNMSGGQKARVALARAVYNDADIYLLDDPLSAVDAHVGEHLFQKCIKEKLKNKTVLLVTHHISILSECDQIIILDNGTIKASGTYHEITHNGIDISQYLPKKNDDKKEEEIVNTDSVSRVRGASEDILSKSRSSSIVAENKDEAKKLVKAEEISEGEVAIHTYISLIRRGGSFTFFIVILFQLATQVLNIRGNFWLGDWGTESLIDDMNGIEMSEKRNYWYLNGYSALLLSSVFAMLISRISLVTHRTQTSHVFHKLCLDKVLASPVSFFDVTPIGRVINRFSQDMAIIDEELSQSISQVIGMGGSCVGCIGAIVIASKGVFLFMIIPLFFLYGFIQKYYRASNTAISRVESITRSPIYADFSQVLAGTSTVRAYKEQTRYINRLEAYSDANTVPGVFGQIAGQWLAIRLDVLGALITLFMGILTVASRSSGFIPASYLGLGLNYAISLTFLLKMTVRILATAETQMNAVERFDFYINTLVSEGDSTLKQKIIKESILEDVPLISADNIELVSSIPKDWPSNGKIEFRNVEMSYRDGPLVLKNVSFIVDSMEKIGVCGRTGCGKSSLMVALFRIEELVSGTILIDDVDISKVPLNLLRSKLCIIPQDSVMFSSSLRFNIDPFDSYTDEKIWEVLDSCDMKQFIMSLPEKLNELVSEGGDNFSAGQRQLICIARALLREPKILVMDEATASIDMETDALIQRMVRNRFKNTTVLTIAHRLDTIFDSDKIAVMNDGLLAEFASSSKLLQTKTIFNELWTRHKQEEKSK